MTTLEEVRSAARDEAARLHAGFFPAWADYCPRHDWLLKKNCAECKAEAVAS